MKKLLGIVVLGLLWCNTAFAGQWYFAYKNWITNKVFIDYAESVYIAKQRAYHKCITGSESGTAKFCLKFWKQFTSSTTSGYREHLWSQSVVQCKHCTEEEKRIAEEEKQKTTKKVQKKTTTTSMSLKLKLIEDMYKSGALTKEDYEEAKRRAIEQN